MEDAMSQLFYLSTEQLERVKPFFPRSHGISRVDDLRVLSGISKYPTAKPGALGRLSLKAILRFACAA